MNLSYWEIKSWLSKIDFTIVGSGIVGLNCALHLKNKFPSSRILILEKGLMPQGASTKNAGFACFGSLSEILEDLKTHSEDEVVNLVNKRLDGLRLLRNTLGDQNIGYQNLGGYEIFSSEDQLIYEMCLAKRKVINKLLEPVFNTDVFTVCNNKFQFKNVQDHYIFNAFEGQIDTGLMMTELLKKVQSLGIQILNSVNVESFSEGNSSVYIKTNLFEFKTKRLCIATNGFARQLTTEDVKPARAQVLITKPIKGLHLRGTFHLDKGFYYFRNIDNRILFGGGRNLDFSAEETEAFGLTEIVQKQLEKLLRETILPNTPFEIDQRWSGIMGVGHQKKVIVKQLSNNVYCGVRLGGMGIAVGSAIGKELAELITQHD